MWTRTAPACPKPQRHSLYSGAGAARAPTPSPERLLRQGPALQPPRARASRDTSEAGSPGPEGPRLPDVSAVGRFICKATPGSVPGPWCFMLSCKRTHTHTRMCAHTHGHLHTGPTGTESKLACRGGTRGTRARGGRVSLGKGPDGLWAEGCQRLSPAASPSEEPVSDSLGCSQARPGPRCCRPRGRLARALKTQGLRGPPTRMVLSLPLPAHRRNSRSLKYTLRDVAQRGAPSTTPPRPEQRDERNTCQGFAAPLGSGRRRPAPSARAAPRLLSVLK